MNHPYRTGSTSILGDRHRVLTWPFICGVLLLHCSAAGWAAPRPGDLFREYRWTNRGGDADGALRVGGRLDYGGGPLTLPYALDLEHATRLEMVIEKLLCHAGTRGLAISINDHPWVEVPEASDIPLPQWAYQHHTYPVVEIPLEQLHAGTGNRFRLKVADDHPWNWPQHLIYGVHFRVYYDAARKPHPTGRLLSPLPNTDLGVHVVLQVEASSPNGRVDRVDFFGDQEDVNLEGDGRYSQWHYHYVKSELVGHIGTATEAPWGMQWDTSWVPDQSTSFRLAAQITDETGLTQFTDAIAGLSFDRPDLTVELCKPYDVPKEWVTRSGEHTQRFRVTGELTSAVRARMVWCSWSPGYMEGVYVNDQLILKHQGPRYAHFVHRVAIDNLSILKPGENLLKTGKTPKLNGAVVHGMEVNWPGVMVLIQYTRSDAASHHKTSCPD